MFCHRLVESADQVIERESRFFHRAPFLVIISPATPIRPSLPGRRGFPL